MDILTIEIGSTITKANGFQANPKGGFDHVAQGLALTSVGQGDVGIGVLEAKTALEQNFGQSIGSPEVFINSSAAGGLRITVHGLTSNMTARAAREASLGAGAIVIKITAGLLSQTDLEEIFSVKPNMIIIAGGVDFGEQDIVLENAKKILNLQLPVPVIYSGNCALQKTLIRMFANSKSDFAVSENVFPDIDVLNVEPLRRIIQDAFSRHIIHAPGMNALSSLTRKPILSTPRAVLLATECLAEIHGNVMVVDVGGATTDVHSVTEGSREFADKLIDPEPRSKRTVEGDLGVFINARHLFEKELKKDSQVDIMNLKPIPISEPEKNLTHWLCLKAVESSVKRHAGTVSNFFSPTGRKQIIRGKDLSAVNLVIGTGGALTRIEGGKDILKEVCKGVGKYLLPKPGTPISLDSKYILSALGTLVPQYPEEVKKTLRNLIL